MLTVHILFTLKVACKSRVVNLLCQVKVLGWSHILGLMCSIFNTSHFLVTLAYQIEQILCFESEKCCSCYTRVSLK